MVEVGIVGYTPLNGHPYSFGSIINGFDENINIQKYPQIEKYLKQNLQYKNGIMNMQCTHVYCADFEISKDISSVIKAKSVENILEFPESLDIALILCDYSSWRTNLIKELLKKNIFIFVDKPLVKDFQELKNYKKDINSKKICSSSMLIHEPKFEKINNLNDLQKIKITYSGEWENYSSHAIEPIVRLISKNNLNISKKSNSSIFLEETNLQVSFIKNKLRNPVFDFDFFYNSGENKKVSIDSNFLTFRSGLINLKNSFNSKNIYREFNEYVHTLKIFEALKNE
tara:strand:- start:562 stop:1416 length:855 start_codon:yes stop_codon:yes gene_type:complete